MDLKTISLAVFTLFLGFIGIAPPVAAQESAFLAAVRDLATTRGNPSVARDRMAAALVEWDRQIANLHSQANTVQGHVVLGLAYRHRGRLSEAVREFDSAIALQPTLSDLHLFRALTLETAGRVAEASQAFRRAWDDDVANPGKAYLVLSRAHDLEAAAGARARDVLHGAYASILDGNNPADAPLVPTLDAVPDTFSATPIAGDGRLAGVFALLAAGKLDEATAALGGKRQTAGLGDSAREQIARAGTAEREGRLSDARRDYAAALEGTLSGRHVLYVGIARLAQVDGDLDAAIDAFAHAVRLSPNDAVLRRECAAAFVAAGRFDDAFTELVAALLIAPGDAEVLAAVGQMFLDSDRAQEAIAPLRRALAVKADRYATHYALAVALSRAGRSGEAAREFETFERLSRQALVERRRVTAGQAGVDGAKR